MAAAVAGVGLGPGLPSWRARSGSSEPAVHGLGTADGDRSLVLSAAALCVCSTPATVVLERVVFLCVLRELWMFVVCWVLMHQAVAGQQSCTPALELEYAKMVFSSVLDAKDSLELSIRLAPTASGEIIWFHDESLIPRPPGEACQAWPTAYGCGPPEKAKQ